MLFLGKGEFIKKLLKIYNQFLSLFFKGKKLDFKNFIGCFKDLPVPLEMFDYIVKHGAQEKLFTSFLAFRCQNWLSENGHHQCISYYESPLNRGDIEIRHHENCGFNGGNIHIEAKAFHSEHCFLNLGQGVRKDKNFIKRNIWKLIFLSDAPQKIALHWLPALGLEGQQQRVISYTYPQDFTRFYNGLLGENNQNLQNLINGQHDLQYLINGQHFENISQRLWAFQEQALCEEILCCLNEIGFNFGNGGNPLQVVQTGVGNEYLSLRAIVFQIPEVDDALKFNIFSHWRESFNANAPNPGLVYQNEARTDVNKMVRNLNPELNNGDFNEICDRLLNPGEEPQNWEGLIEIINN